MSFKQKLYDKVYNISNRNKFSDDVINFMELAYTEHKISLLTIVDFFYPVNKKSDDQVIYNLNELIRKQYKPVNHNVGKLKGSDESIYDRYFKQDNITEWLKLLHYLITHFYSINKSVSYVSNKHMAIKLGYIDPYESDKEVLKKASRKVTDSLAILKYDLNLIDVEQKYNYGQKGSYHMITANWHQIIDLFRNFDDAADGSIRFRKSIKYRIITFLRYIDKASKKLEAKTKALLKLFNKQKNKYLNGLILYRNSEEFHENRQVLFKWLSKFHFLEPIINKLNTDYIIPNFNGRQLLLEVKDEYVYDVLTYLDSTKTRLKLDYMIDATIKPIF